MYCFTAFLVIRLIPLFLNTFLGYFYDNDCCDSPCERVPSRSRASKFSAKSVVSLALVFADLGVCRVEWAVILQITIYYSGGSAITFKY